MDISSVESIEGLPYSYTAVVPITDQPENTGSQSGNVGVVSILVGDEEMQPADLPGEVTIRPDINEPISEWLNADPGLAGLTTYDDSLNLYRSVGHSLASSMMRGPGIWHINDIYPVDDETSELTVGRLGLPEFKMRMPQAATVEISSGDRVLGPEQLYTGGGIFGWGQLRVDFEPDDEQPSPIPIWVPLQRLHRPRHNGCAAEYQLQTGVDEDVEVSLTVLGIGGGGSVIIGGTFGTDMSTEGECIETVVPATLQLQFGKTLVNGTEISHGMRATITDLNPKAKKTRAIPPENDACERPRSAVALLPQTDSFDQTEVPEGTEYWDSITLRQEVVGKMTVGLELGSQVPFKFGMDYVRTTSQEITVRTLLARGAHYLGYAPSRDGGFELERKLEICWTTQQS